MDGMHTRGSEWGPARCLQVFGFLLSAAALVLGITPQKAFAGDGRPATPKGEMIAQYRHSLDREPDPGGLKNYMSFVNENCQWGIIDGSFKIANSAEARTRWSRNGDVDKNLAGMLYASLLDRAPDPGGLSTYTNNIRKQGLEWATAEMMGSAEYRGRLAKICNATDGLNATMVDWQIATEFIDDVLIHNAKTMGANCAVIKGIQKAAGLKKDYKSNKAAFVHVAGEITNRVYNKLSDPCGAALAYIKASLRIIQIIDAGAGYNPVFIQFDTHRSWWTLRSVQYFTVRIGPDPTHWDRFVGKVGGF
jgi:hypothetical protein